MALAPLAFAGRVKSDWALAAARTSLRFRFSITIYHFVTLLSHVLQYSCETRPANGRSRQEKARQPMTAVLEINRFPKDALRQSPDGYKLNRVAAALAGSHANNLVNRKHEDLSISNLARAGNRRDHIHDRIDLFVRNDDLELHYLELR